ncbi:hypothetical protein RJT34_02728 [Clitoria ternatea]|uniref:Protein kinase domain-containing protein n=1 Tax=Clitoria ternatea TaxID=43366 RepID=A0AAN9KJG0_CLITE
MTSVLRPLNLDDFVQSKAKVYNIIVVHSELNVKSSNILLDGEFGAKVTDFGVAKIVRGVNQGAESLSVIAESYEYAYTLWVNEKSDIYSFGVVILELVTRKPPLDLEYGEKGFSKMGFLHIGTERTESSD